MYSVIVVLFSMIIGLEIISIILEKNINFKYVEKYDIYEILSGFIDKYQIPSFMIETDSKTFSYSYLQNKIYIEDRKLAGSKYIKGVHKISHAVDSHTKITSTIFVMMPHIKIARWILIGIILISNKVEIVQATPFISLYMALSILSVFNLIYIESRANILVKSFNNLGRDFCVMTYIWISFFLQIIWSVFFIILPINIIKILSLL